MSDTTVTEAFIRDLARLNRNEGEITLVVKDHLDAEVELKVHKFLLQTRAKPLYRAIVSDFKGADTLTIDMREEDVYLVRRLIDHLYGVKYFAGKYDEDEASAGELNTHLSMYKIAEKYMMNDLKKEAYLGFKHLIDTLAPIPDKYNAMYEIITEVYAQPSHCRELRELLVTEGLGEMQRYKDLPEFNAKDVSEWVLEVVLWYEDERNELRSIACTENPHLSDYDRGEDYNDGL